MQPAAMTAVGLLALHYPLHQLVQATSGTGMKAAGVRLYLQLAGLAEGTRGEAAGGRVGGSCGRLLCPAPPPPTAALGPPDADKLYSRLSEVEPSVTVNWSWSRLSEAEPSEAEWVV